MGGIANNIVQLLPEFEKMENIYISLITKYSQYKPTFNKLKIFQYNKFKIRQLNTIYFNLKGFCKIISLNKLRKIDILFLFRFSYYESFIPVLLNFFLKIPIFFNAPTDFDTNHRESLSISSNSGIFKMIYYGWMKFFKKYFLKRRSVYIQAINQNIFNDFLGLEVNRKNLILLPNGINTNNYEDIRKIDHEEINFGYVGRLIKTKNIRFLIKTFNEYLKHFPNDKLLIYGTGPEKDFILRYIDNKNLKDRILIMGFEQNKVKIYSKIDVLIHPSYGEGLPNTLLEAALTKTFIIASNVKGNRDIIKHKETGFLFNPIDQNDLLDKLLLFKNEEDLRQKIIEKTRDIVFSNYRINKVVESLLNFIKTNIKNS